MKLYLRQSGGPGITIEGELQTSELPETLCERLERALRENELREAEKKTANPHRTDAYSYKLSIENAAEDRQVYQFSDAQDIPEVLDLLDALVHELIRKRRRET